MTQRYEKPWTQSVQGARVLFHEMNECFRYVEPEAKNLGSWGHELRQLLILACTEVESAWKAVLTANQYGASGNLKTNDYVKLLAPMRLDEWEVALPLHVGVAKFRPFKGWKKAKPTKSLDWYNAYNAVKHDRESAFKEATLRRMITAMGAVFVMVSAQFGSWRRVGGGAQSLREMQHLFPTDFLVTKEPKWDPRELYVPPEGGGGHNWTGAGWTEVSCRL